MPSKSTISRSVYRAALATVVTLLGTDTLLASDADWAVSGAFGTADWQLNTNWTSANATPLPPNGVGVFASINTDISAPSTIELSSLTTANVTIGRLDIGDSNATHGFSIAAGQAGDLLVFDNGGNGAQINRLSAGFDTVSAGIRLDDNLTISGTSGGITFSGPITSTGTKNLIINGSGTATTNSNFVFSGLVNNTGTITNSGTNTVGATNVTFTGGIGSNVTAITQSSALSGIAVTGLAVNSGGTTMTSNSARAFAVTNVTGTGNLLLVNNGSGANSVLTVTGSVNNTGTITNTGSATTSRSTIGGTIGNNVTSVIQDSPTAFLTLNGTNSAWTGNVIIKRGTLDVATNGSALGAGTVYLGDDTPGNSNSATLRVNQAITITTPINVRAGSSGALLITNQNTGAPFVDSPITLNNNVILGNNVVNTANSTTYRGGVTGTGNISFAATLGNVFVSTAALNNVGTLTNNTVSGGGTTTISGGIGSNVTAITQASGFGTLSISTTAITVSSAGTTLSNTAGRSFTVAGGVNGTGDLILKNDFASTVGIAFSTSAINNIGKITNSGAGGSETIATTIGSNVTGIVQNSSSSNLILSGNNSTGSGGSTNSVTVSAGTLQMGVATALGSGNTVFVGSGTSFDLNAFDQMIAGLNDRSGSGGTITNAGASGKILTLGGGGTYSFSGALTAPSLPRLGITKSGSGTQTLSGISTYTGTTNINNGTLRVNGSLDSLLVNVNTGTLEGSGNGSTTGKLAGAVTVGDAILTSSARDATLSPGGSGIGTLLTGNLTFKSDGIYTAQTDGTTSGTGDQTAVTGTVALGAGIAALNTNYSTGSMSDGQRYFILVNDGTDAVSGYFAGLQDLNGSISLDDPIVATFDTFTMRISYTGDFTTNSLTGGNDVVLYAPEPASLGLFALPVMAGLSRRRRRRQPC